MSKRNQFELLNILRFVLAILMVLNHCTFLAKYPVEGWIWNHFFHCGRSVVNIFFILSAFVIGYRYGEDDYFSSLQFKPMMEFYKKRITRIYPLYIITVLYTGVYAYLKKWYPLSVILRKSIWDIFLVQSFSWEAWSWFNSAAWFLSTLFFLYLITPFILTIIGKVTKNKSRNSRTIISLLFVECIVVIILMILTCSYLRSNEIISDDQYIWLTYIFPLFRVPHYFLGLLIGTIRANRCNTNVKPTLFQLVGDKTVAFISILVLVLCNIASCTGWGIEIIILEPLQVIISLTVVFYLSFVEGVPSEKHNFLDAILLAKLSFPIYLIHYPLIQTGGMRFLDNHGFFEIRGFSFFAVIGFLIISIFLGLIYLKAESTIRKHIVSHREK